MDMNDVAEAYFDEGIEEQTQAEQEPLKKCGDSVSSAALSQPSGCFDCNICLDFAADPVVTLCGHLYCWPCIYKWLQVETESSQQCPVCKAPLSENALVPLYGRGHAAKRSHQNVDIPRRPSLIRPQDDLNADVHPVPVRRHGHQHYHLHHHHHHLHYPFGDGYVSSTGTAGTMHSTAVGVLGGLAFAVLPWVCRNHRDGAGVHYESPFSVAASGGGGSPRMRRQEMEVEMSLHQIWLFLLCCAVLCLVLF